MATKIRVEIQPWNRVAGRYAEGGWMTNIVFFTAKRRPVSDWAALDAEVASFYPGLIPDRGQCLGERFAMVMLAEADIHPAHRDAYEAAKAIRAAKDAAALDRYRAAVGR